MEKHQAVLAAADAVKRMVEAPLVEPDPNERRSIVQFIRQQETRSLTREFLTAPRDTPHWLLSEVANELRERGAL
jgi:hypothetical protein